MLASWSALGNEYWTGAYEIIVLQYIINLTLSFPSKIIGKRRNIR